MERFSIRRIYKNGVLWLRRICTNMSIKQRKIVLCILCSIYFISCCYVIASIFITDENDGQDIYRSVIHKKSFERLDSLKKNIIIYKTDIYNGD